MLLKDIASVKGGKRLPKTDQLVSYKTNHPYIRIRDMYQSYPLQLNDDFEYITDDTYEKIKRYTVEQGDVILAVVGNTIGLVSLIGESLDGANLTENCNKIVDLQQYDNKFLYYYLTSKQGQEEIKKGIIGSSQPKLPIYNIEKFEIPEISLDSQKKIVSVLETIDKKININEKINNNLYAQAKAIFEERFINIESIPEGWKKGNLLDIADYLNGLAMQKFRPKENETGIPVIKIKELRQGSCDSNSELCSPNIKPAYIIQDGDVIFSWSGSLLVGIWCGGKCGLNQHLFKVTSENYDKWFYYLWTSYHLDRFIAIAADKATTMGHIKREELSKAEVLIPAQNDYKELDSIMAPIFELIISNSIETCKLAALRDALLPKLMSGEIDVSEVTA